MKIVVGLGVALALLLPHAVWAQQPVVPYVGATGGSPYLPVDSSHPLAVTLGNPGGTALFGNATGTTGAVTGTLAAATGKTTYICGFAVSAVGTGAVGPITVSDGTFTLTYQLTATSTGVTLAQSFSPCLPASAVHTAISTVTTADGSASAVAVNSWGYQQ